MTSLAGNSLLRLLQWKRRAIYKVIRFGVWTRNTPFTWTDRREYDQGHLSIISSQMYYYLIICYYLKLKQREVNNYLKEIIENTQKYSFSLKPNDCKTDANL